MTKELQHAESQMRLAGWHVVLDDGESRLWVFELNEATELATTDRSGRHSRMVEEYELTGK